MSWLNTSSFASLAKSALREAQKTIDKALDITESATVGSHGKEIENFFLSFGVEENESVKPSNEDETSNAVVVSEPSSSPQGKTETPVTSSNLWGNFAGSFFDLKSAASGTPAPTTTAPTASAAPYITTEDAAVSSSANVLSPPKPTVPNSEQEVENVIVDPPEQQSAEAEPTTPIQQQPAIFNTESCENLPDTSVSDLSSASASSSLTVVSPDWADEEEEDDDSTVECLPQQQSASENRSVKEDMVVVDREEMNKLLAEAIAGADGSLKTETASVSGDELETATSSDIEVIASPQAGIRHQQILKQADCRSSGSSSATKSHQRQPSEASSDESLMSIVEMERMARKICELGEILQAREGRLVEVSRSCAQLTEQKEELMARVRKDDAERAAHAEAVRRMTEDFAHRISSLEKRYHEVVAEKEALVKQLDSAKFRENLAEQVTEKDQTISELRIEGEKLSKQQLQQSTTIKKLRAKEKETDQQIKQLKDKSDEMEREVGRLKKNLSAKEELERNQIEAIRQLTANQSQQDKELAAGKVVARDATDKLHACKIQIESLEKELADAKSRQLEREGAELERNLSTELALRQKIQAEFESSASYWQQEKSELNLRIDELSRSLAQADAAQLREREQARSELSRAMQRLQEAEARSEELSQALTVSTRPLLRQVESLQQALNNQRMAEEKSTKNVQTMLSDATVRLDAAVEKEAATRSLYLALQSKVNHYEDQLSIVNHKYRTLDEQFQSERARNESREAFATERVSSLEVTVAELEEELLVSRDRISCLDNLLALEKAAVESEKRRCSVLQLMLDKSAPDAEHAAIHASRGSSPTSSLGKISMSGSITESFSSNPWTSAAAPVAMDCEVFQGGLMTPVPSLTLYDALRAGTNTAVFEGLQSQLKMRDGEVQQLQNQLASEEKTRNSLTRELTQLISSNEDLSRRLARLEPLQTQLSELQTNYNALLQMYGEKIEENEELKLDLVDVKEMYKAQIDQLLKT